MIPSTSPASPTPSVRRWRLWVDGEGGFLLVMGSMIRVGRADAGFDLDVSLLADAPRLAGEIRHQDGEYFWHRASSTIEGVDQDRSNQWIVADRPLEGLGSARLTLRKPSPLCSAATLTLQPPHRFGEHVDGVLLVGDTWLIGATSDCHVRCRTADSVVVMVWKDQAWWGKVGFDGEPVEFLIGSPMTIGSATMTLEVV